MAASRLRPSARVHAAAARSSVAGKAPIHFCFAISYRWWEFRLSHQDVGWPACRFFDHAPSSMAATPCRSSTRVVCVGAPSWCNRRPLRPGIQKQHDNWCKTSVPCGRTHHPPHGSQYLSSSSISWLSLFSMRFMITLPLSLGSKVSCRGN
jgi:hypothetical protein